MSQSVKSPKRWTGRAKVSLLIWTFFFIALAGSALSVSLGTPAASAAGTTVTTSAKSAALGTASTTTTIAPVPSFLNTAATPKYPTPINCSPYGTSTQSCYQMYQANPTGLLPAWRWWTSSILLNTSPGVNPGAAIFMEVFDFIASALFAISSVIWFLLLSLIKYALDLSLVAAAGNTINRGFAWLSASITGSGVLLLVCAFALLIAFRMFLKGSVHRLLALMLVVVVPIAAMWTLADIVNSHPAAGGGQSVPTGTPAWLALQGTEVIDYVAGSIATGFGGLSPSATTSTGTSLSCANYEDALYAEYASFSSPTVQGSASSDPFAAQAWTSSWQNAGTTGIKQAGVVALAASSQLWEQAYLTDWVAAQYGSYTQGQNLYCRQLETSANINPFEQSALMQVTAGAPPVSGEAFNISPAAPADTIRATLFAFDACTWNGSRFVAANDWQYYDSSGVSDANAACNAFLNSDSSFNVAQASSATAIHGGCVFQSGGRYGTLHCTTANGAPIAAPAPGASINPGSKVAGSGDGIDSNGVIAYLDALNTTSALSAAYTQAIQNAAGATPAVTALAGTGSGSLTSTQGQLAQNYHAMTSYWGQNETYAILDGLLSLLSAIAYGYALGALALGTILAQIGLVIMLLLLPATLILLAIPTKEGKRIRSGVTLMRTTLGFIVSKAVLTIVLVIMLEMILWLQVLIHAGTGPLSGVVNAVIPLAVLFLVKKMLSAIGMPNLTSLQGATAMPTAAAMALSGSESANKSVMGGLTRALGSDAGRDKDGNLLLNKDGTLARPPRGLNRFDAGIKRGTKNSLSGAKDGTVGFLGLDRMRTQLFGRRDAKGNLTEMGHLQRLNSLAGILNIAKDGTLTGPATRALLSSPLGQAFDAYATDRDRKRGIGSYEVAQAQVAERSRIMAATRFKTRNQRLAIIKQLGVSDNDEILANQRALRDADGSIVRDPSGMPVYAFRQSLEAPPLHFSKGGGVVTVDPETGALRNDGIGQPVYRLMKKNGDGSLEAIEPTEYRALFKEDPNSVSALTEGPSRLLNWKDAQALSPAERSKLTSETTLAAVLGPEALYNHQKAFMDELQLRDGQAVFSTMGHNGVINPKLADANGRGRLLVTKSAETDVAAAMYSYNYLPNEIKQRPAGFTDTEYGVYLNLLLRRTGGIDNNGDLVNTPMAYGINLNTAAGRAELEAEQAAQPSAFDKIRINLSPEEHRATVASARDLAKGYSGAPLRREVAVAWAESARDYSGTAQRAKDTLNVTDAEMKGIMQHFERAATQANYMRDEIAKARALEASIGDLMGQRNQASQSLASTTAGDDTAELDRQLSALESKLQAAQDAHNKIPEYETRLGEHTATMRNYSREITALAESIIPAESQALESAESMQYMFEYAQASRGKKGKLGTTDMSVIADTRDKAEKIRQGNLRARQLELDELTASLTRLMNTPTADPYAQQQQAKIISQTIANINRDVAKITDEAISTSGAIIAAGNAALAEDTTTAPKRIQW